MTAIFRINQVGITGGKPPIGDYDVARADLDLFSVGGVVQLAAQDVSQNFTWQVVSQPEGSAIVLGNPDTQTATLSISVTGGYIIRLTVDEGYATKDIRELYVGVPLANSQLPLPAGSETVQDNRVSDVPGAERKFTAWAKWADANVGGGSSGVFEEPVGPTASTLRTGSGAVVAGDYCFSSGAVNNIDSDSSYVFVYGGHTVPSTQNTVVNTDYGVVFGRNNDLVDGDDSFIAGRDNYVEGSINVVFGTGNIVGSGGSPITNCFVYGVDTSIYSVSTVALGHEHQSIVDGAGSVLLGNYAIAEWSGSRYHANNPYLDYGAGQDVLSHLSRITVDATPLSLRFGFPIVVRSLDMVDETVYLCELRLIARTPESTGVPSKVKTWTVWFTAHRDFDGNAALHAQHKTVLSSTSLGDESTWDVAVSIDVATAETPIEINVQGDAVETVRWYGVLRTTYYRDINLAPV